MPDENRGPRERMVYSAAQLVRAQGPAATGVREVVEHAGAPRGSFQHYFPGGKDQLVGEALLWSGDFAARWVANYPRTTGRPTPGGLFAHLVRFWKDEFTTRGYVRGCPIMATTADLAGGESAANEQLAAALDQWEGAVVDELARMSIPRRRARRLATLMISTLEGAIMSARVRRDPAPLTTVVAELTPVLNAAATD
jgi:AcrR family transcriptional regulator